VDNGPDCRKNRYISLPIEGHFGMAALRVTLSELYRPDPPNVGAPGPDLSSSEGTIFFVGPAADVQDSEVPPTTFRAATLQCEPHYQDWSAEGVVHIAGAGILPSSTYLVEALSPTCMGTEDTCTDVVASETLRTSRWGDVVAPFQEPAPEALTQPNIQDVAAVVDKFKGVALAPIKARSQMQPNAPDPTSPINIVDVANTVDGFKSLAYPYAGPTPCS
jgi:hypothetical protein